MRWGIIATGSIAGSFARDLTTSRTGELVAVGSRALDSAEAFAAQHGDVRPHGSYDALLADGEVEAVYIATPHPMHAALSIAAARAGKHVLCEKPFTMSEAEAVAVFDAAREHDVFAMEAFMYRCHPQTARVLEELATIGDVLDITAVHSFKATPDRLTPEGRLLSPALGGGALLDVGCYCASGVRLVTDADVIAMRATRRLSATGVDESSKASVELEGGIRASLACSIVEAQRPLLHVVGTAGEVRLEDPWLPPGEDRGLYAYEADEVADCVGRGERESSRMSWADTLATMHLLDRWRTS
jgi:predicted dehydrogenase